MAVAYMTYFIHSNSVIVSDSLIPSHGRIVGRKFPISIAIDFLEGRRTTDLTGRYFQETDIRVNTMYKPRVYHVNRKNILYTEQYETDLLSVEEPWS